MRLTFWDLLRMFFIYLKRRGTCFGRLVVPQDSPGFIIDGLGTKGNRIHILVPMYLHAGDALEIRVVQQKG